MNKQNFLIIIFCITLLSYVQAQKIITNVQQDIDQNFIQLNEFSEWNQDDNISETQKINDDVCSESCLTQPNTLIIPETLSEDSKNWEYTIFNHSNTGYICFGIISQENSEKISGFSGLNYENTVSACTDGSLYNYPNNNQQIFVKGRKPIKQQNNGIQYNFNYSPGHLIIQIQNNDEYNFQAKFELPTDQKYIPWFETYGQHITSFQLQNEQQPLVEEQSVIPVEKDQQTNEQQQPIVVDQGQEQSVVPPQVEQSAVDQPLQVQQPQWYTQTNGANLVDDVATGSSTNVSIFLTEQPIENGQSFQVEIIEHQPSGWICIGLTNNANLPKITANPNKAYYGSSAVICTDQTFYNANGTTEFNNTKNQMPRQKSAENNIFTVQYIDNTVRFTDSMQGIDFIYTLSEGQYLGYVETNGVHTVEFKNQNEQQNQSSIIPGTNNDSIDEQSTDQEPSLENQDIPKWYSDSNGSHLVDDIASGSTSAVSVFLTESPIQDGQKFSVEVILHQTSGWICLGLTKEANIAKINANPNTSYYSSSTVICTDATFYNTGVKQFNNTQNQMPKRELAQGIIFTVEKLGNTVNFTDNIEGINFQFTIPEGNYFGYVDLNGLQTVKLVDPNQQLNNQEQLPVVVDQGQEQSAVPPQVEQSAVDQPLQVQQPQWYTQTNGANLVDSVATGSSSNVSIFLTEQPIENGQSFQVEIIEHQPSGWICIGLTNNANLPKITANPNKAYYGSSAVICTDQTFYNANGTTEFNNTKNQMPRQKSAENNIFTVQYIDNTVRFTDSMQGIDFIYTLSEGQYLGYVETNGVHTVEFKNQNDQQNQNSVIPGTNNDPIDEQSTDQEPSLENQDIPKWYSDSNGSHLVDDIASGSTSAVSVFLTESPIQDGQKFSVEVILHQTSGWICLGLTKEANIAKINVNPNTSYYSSSTVICTDATFYNTGEKQFNNTQNQMPKRELAQGIIFTVEKLGNTVNFTDNIEGINFQFTIPEGNYFGYVDLNGLQTVKLVDPNQQLNNQEQLPVVVDQGQEQSAVPPQVEQSAVDQPLQVQQPQWYTQTNGANLVDDVATGSSTNVSIFLTEQPIENGQSFQVEIIEHQPSGWICIGLTNNANLPKITANPNKAYYGSSAVICTDQTFYNANGTTEFNNTKNQMPRQKSAENNIFTVQYMDNSVRFTDSMQGIDFIYTLSEGQYLGYVETNGVHTVKFQNAQITTNIDDTLPINPIDQELPYYEPAWHTESTGANLVDNVVTGSSTNISVITTYEGISDGQTFNVEIVLHQPSGWVCLGLSHENNWNSINTSPDISHYSSSAVICTDVTFYNPNGEKSFNNTKNQMPRQQNSQGIIFTVEKKGNTVNFTDNVDGIEFQFTLAQGNYFGYIETNGEQIVKLINGEYQKPVEIDQNVVIPSGEDQSLAPPQVEQSSVGQPVQEEQNQVSDPQVQPIKNQTWQTQSEDATLVDNIISGSEDTAVTITDEPLQNGEEYDIEIIHHTKNGSVCFGLTNEINKQQIDQNPNVEYTNVSNVICTDQRYFNNDGEIDFNGTESNMPKQKESVSKTFTVQLVDDKINFFDKEDTILITLTIPQGNYVGIIETHGEQIIKVVPGGSRVPSCIDIYSECGYQGQTEQICDDKPIDFEFDIKSIKIPQDKCITLFHVTCFHGYTSVLSQDVECLENVDTTFLIQKNVKLFKGEVSKQNQVQITKVETLFNEQTPKKHLRKSLSQNKSLQKSFVQMKSKNDIQELYKDEI